MLWSDDRVEQISERGLNLVNPEFYYVNRLIVSDIRDDYEAALATQAAEIRRLQRQVEKTDNQAQATEIERLRTENADQVTRIEDLKSEVRGLEREVGRMENIPVPSLTAVEMIRQLTMSGHFVVAPRDMESFRYIGGACPVCGQVHP